MDSIKTPETGKVFFIPGMFSPFINAFLGTYFIDQIHYLNQAGVPTEVIPVHTEGLISKNAEIIRDHALKSSSITAFCHSKGGIDLLHALLTYPEIHERFKKIIFMQSPFYGTPLADLATKNAISSLLTKAVFTVSIRGDVKAIEELTTTHRQSYMEHHQQRLKQLTRTLNIECIGSSKNPEPGRFDSILRVSRDLMYFHMKLPNDGMIPQTSAFIEGTKQTSIADLDHASAVIRMTPQHFDRLGFSKQIFSEVLA